VGLGPHHRQLLQAIVAVHQQVVSLVQMLSLINIWIADPSKSITALISERAVASLEPTQSLEGLSNSDSATAEYIASVGANTGDLYATIDQLGLVLNEKPDLNQLLQEIRQEIQATSILTIAHLTPPQIRRESMSQKIGNFKLLQKLGEGGMGTVWMAEQEKPVRRHVALKVIKAGLADQQILARFEAERQALAMMDHVNIARVYDAGTTETSQPFFVMELVRGIPFAEYCDQHSLSLEDRLQLFIPICRAVHHAHQKGIIHRDLKPSNVLVALVDGVPVPKVIDFGLAKAIQQQTKLSERTMFTEFGQVVGTLRYMSPEQAEMNALDVDTRTDIYSLGVMLYEVLTGTTPLEKATLENEPIYRVLEAIRTKEPPRPSDRLSSSSVEAIAGISLQRRIDSRKLKKILQGELDWIVMKSIDKDRSRRYGSAGEFADDIEGYLTGKAVRARPPSTTYQIQKFVRRNRGIVRAAILIMCTAFAGLGGIIWFALDAQKQRMVTESTLVKESDARRRADEALEDRMKSDEARVEAESNRAKAEVALMKEEATRGIARKLMLEVEQMAELAYEESKKSAIASDRAADLEQRNQDLLRALFLEPLKPTNKNETTQTLLAKRLFSASAKQRELKSSETAQNEALLWLGIINLGFEKEATKSMNDSIDSHRQLSAGKPWWFINWGTDAAEVLIEGNRAELAEKLLRSCLDYGQSDSTQKNGLSFYRTNYMLGMALFAQSKQVDAERFLLAAYRELEEQKSKLPQGAVLPKIPSEMMVRTIDSLIEVYSSSDRRNERDKWERLKKELSGNQRSNK